MRIILLGAPGSGKGTQARRLVDSYKVPQISTGDLLRTAAAEGSETGRAAERHMKEGALVPDSLVIDLVSQRMLKPDTRRGFILDGFPRNIPQAQELDTRLGWVSRPIQIVVNFEVEEQVLVQRLTGRRNCEKCGAIYNIHFNAPRIPDRCDDCGATLRVRDDDNEETVVSRLAIYHQQTELLVQYYRAQHKLRTLNANGDVEAIFTRLCEMIDTEIRPLENKVISVHGGEGHATHTQIVGGKIVREVTGAEVRMTRVQPRQPNENGESRDGETGALNGAATKKSKKVSASKKKTAAETKVDSTAARERKPATPVAADAPASKRAAKKAKADEPAAATKKKSSTRKKTTTKRSAGKTAPAGAVKKTTRKKVVKKVAAKPKAVKKATTKKATTKKKTTKKTATRKSTSAKVAKRKVTKRQLAAKATATRAAKPTRPTSKPTAAKRAGQAARKKKVAKATGKVSAIKKSAARKKVVTKKTARKKVAAKKIARKKATKKVAVRKLPARTTRTVKKSVTRKRAAGKAAPAKKVSRKRTR